MDIQSAYGYGGPISNCDAPEFLAAADVAFSQWAFNHSIVVEFLRFHPLVPHANWYMGEILENRETVHMDLERDFFAQYRSRRKTYIRRFMRSGLEVARVESNAIATIFPEIYWRNMEHVGAEQAYYFPREYFSALAMFDKAECWAVKSGDQYIASAVILVSEDARVVEYHLGAREPSSEHDKAMMGLLHCVAEHYQSRDFQYFYLGGGRSAAPNDSLFFFKAGFSPLRGVFRLGDRVYDNLEYMALREKFPLKAATGRILFYKE